MKNSRRQRKSERAGEREGGRAGETKRGREEERKRGTQEIDLLVFVVNVCASAHTKYEDGKEAVETTAPFHGAGPNCGCSILQHAATRCNTLQHAATRRNTLHHTCRQNSTLGQVPIVAVFSLVEEEAETSIEGMGPGGILWGSKAYAIN